MDAAKPEGPSATRDLRLNENPVLVIQTAFLGDLLLTIPLIKRIRELRPRAPLYLVTREGFGRLIKELGLVDEVFEIRKKDPKSYAAIVKRLKPLQFEWVLCPHQSFTSALFAWKIRAQIKISFKQWWNFPFFRKRIEKDMRLPDALRQISLLRSVDPGLDQLMRSLENVDLKKANAFGGFAKVPSWASLDMQIFLNQEPSPMPVVTKTACIFPGSVWPTKRWTEEGFAELGAKLIKEGFQIYWLGTKDEVPLAKRLEIKVSGSKSIAGQLSLLQTLVLLSHSKVAICNDSGGQHLATVAGVPVVSIFGPTVLDLGFRPWSNRSMVAELFDVPCRPCGAHGHKKCPIGTHECMRKLPSGLVHHRVHQVLALDLDSNSN